MKRQLCAGPQPDLTPRDGDEENYSIRRSDKHVCVWLEAPASGDRGEVTARLYVEGRRDMDKVRKKRFGFNLGWKLQLEGESFNIR